MMGSKAKSKSKPKLNKNNNLRKWHNSYISTYL